MESSWEMRLKEEFSKPYMQELKQFLQQRKKQKVVIYPHSNDWFNAFEHTPFDKVKVVILGQDPYHGAGQAHGLSFSVPKGIKLPPSLVNIFKELSAEDDNFSFTSGDLTPWAKQGVFLLNSVLTVEKSQAGSHQGKGWEIFTDRVIELLSQQREGLVFMLWGSYAQKKGRLIDSNKHCVLKAPHPSPLSAYRGFFGCEHFSKANSYLEQQGQGPINWSLL